MRYFWLTTVFYRVEVWYRILPCLGLCDNCIASDLRWETNWVSDLTWCALIKTRSVAHFSFRLSYFLGLFENFDLHEVIFQQYGSKIASPNYHMTQIYDICTKTWKSIWLKFKIHVFLDEKHQKFISISMNLTV